MFGSYPNLQDLLYNKNKRKFKIPKEAPKSKNIMTSLVNMINSGETQIRRYAYKIIISIWIHRLTVVQKLPDDYSSTVAPKIRGLFEYKYDPFSSVDDYN